MTKELDMTKLCRNLTRHNLLQKKGRKMARSTKNSIAFYEKYLLTVEEAAVYFHIGYKKMRSLIKDYPGAKWILYSGSRIMIKREQFEKWLDNQSAI